MYYSFIIVINLCMHWAAHCVAKCILCLPYNLLTVVRYLADTVDCLFAFVSVHLCCFT